MKEDSIAVIKIKTLLNLKIKHIPKTHIKCDSPGRCYICDGGLILCITCGGFEGSLPTHCPGFEMTEDQEKAVAHRQLNFINGHWEVLPKSSFPTF